ncbi:MAG: APC family permease, partial [Burkholderiales bacterium]|nr:APC family permease [Burkholderiales bacterium]
TLNATAFGAVIGSLGFSSPLLNHAALIVVLALEAGLLFVAANTGFLGGPAVLANMAADSWVPRHFRELSSRLVTQNGLLLMGSAALAVLIWSEGDVTLLVVLYSINVFLTFSLSLYGLCVYWWRNRQIVKRARRRFLLSLAGLAVTSSILAVLIVEKFDQGWVTILITGTVVGICVLIRKHYDETRAQLRQIDQLFAPAAGHDDVPEPPALDPRKPTAIFLVGKNRGVGMHTLLWVQRLFPDHFKNFIFLSAGEVDTHSFDGQGALRTLQYQIRNSLRYYTNFCGKHGLAAAAYDAYGTDPVAQLDALTETVMADFPNSVCFASKLIFVHDNIFTRWLHNQTALHMQRRLHLRGRQMVILPMKVS